MQIRRVLLIISIPQGLPPFAGGKRFLRQLTALLDFKDQQKVARTGLHVTMRGVGGVAIYFNVPIIPAEWGSRYRTAGSNAPFMYMAVLGGDKMFGKSRTGTSRDSQSQGLLANFRPNSDVKHGVGKQMTISTSRYRQVILHKGYVLERKQSPREFDQNIKL